MLLAAFILVIVSLAPWKVPPVKSFARLIDQKSPHNHINEPKPVAPKETADDWTRVKLGMSRTEIWALLGNAGSVNESTIGGEKYETWAYDLGRVSFDRYHVVFWSTNR